MRLLVAAVIVTCLAGMGLANGGSIVALKRDAGLTSGGETDARFSNCTVQTVTVSDTGLDTAGDGRWYNEGASSAAGSYCLYKFDLSSIPTGSTINLAQLRLYHTQGNGGLGNGDVSRITTHSWMEGARSFTYPGAAGGASYAHPNGYNTGPNQNASGGGSAPLQSWGTNSDSFFSLTADAESPISPSSSPTGTGYHVYNVTSHVQAWVNGTKSNYGWAQANGYWDFHFSEAGTAQEPVLFIDYAPNAPDTTPPAKIADLRVTGSTITSITLTWTAPGDDGMTGRAMNYDVHYCLNPITDQTWPNNQKAAGVPAPADPGTVQSMTVTGLTSGTTYYFAIKTSDEVPNYSDLSNVVSGQTLVNTDNTPPATVTNLVASNPTATGITLTWTAPGDDGSTGTAASYDIRYSTSTIDANNWANGTQVAGEPTPAAAGTVQSMVVTGLTADTMYYFAIKTSDEVPNVSGLSNIASGRTAQLGGTLQVTPGPLTFSGLVGSVNPTAQGVTVQNSGSGTLHWTATVRTPAPSWISLSNPTGTDNGSFAVNVNWQGLSAGAYVAYVDVTDPQAANSPQTVNVICNINAGPTNATWTGAVGTDEASRSWSLAGNWNPAGVPGAGTNALVNASTRYPLADADLPGSPTIEVAAGGQVLQKPGVTLTTPIILSGGTWTTCTQDFWGQAWGNGRTLSSSLTVTAPSVLGGMRGCYLNINGPLTGNGQLTFRSTDQYQGAGPVWYVNHANNPFTGPVILDANNNAVVQIWASRALGTGDITVRSSSTLSFGVTQDFSGASRTPVIHMDSGTIAAPSAPNESAVTNVTVPLGIDVTSTGGKIAAGGWSRENIYSGAVTLSSDLTLAGGAYLGTTENSFRVTGAISGHGRVVVSGTDHNMGCCGCLGGGVVVLDSTANSYDGGTVVQDGFLRATSEGALSNGPITLVYQELLDRNNISTVLNGLRLTKPTPGNWQLSNNLLGNGLIYVENGSASYTLTASGSTISPSTGGTAAGTLTVQGNLAFARNGSQPVTLNIDVFGSGSPLVISNDALAVTRNVSGLSNVALNVTVTGATQTDLVGKTLTILTSGNNLTGQSFASVTVPTGWRANLTYGNGSITMTLGRPNLIGDINGDGYVNVQDLLGLVTAWASHAADKPTLGSPASANWNAAADLSGDGYVNVGDLQILVANWGRAN